MSLNEARMYDLIEDIFNTGNDPTQLGFNESDIEKLIALSPHTLQEASNEDGPYAWVSVFPTSLFLMDQFVMGLIDERQLFDRTTVETPKEVVYLCSTSASGSLNWGRRHLCSRDFWSEESHGRSLAQTYCKCNYLAEPIIARPD